MLTQHFFIMRSYHFFLLLSWVIIISLTGCQKEDPGSSVQAETPVKEIKTFENSIANEDLLLGMPIRLKFDDETRHLFIHDLPKWRITEIDDSSNVVNTFGTRGNGPGEIGAIADFFITKEHLFITDWSHLLIHKYTLQDGQHISSMDYGQALVQKNNMPGGGSPPQLPLNDNNSQPFVTLNETILLPTHGNGDFLYQALNWKGDSLAGIGETPEGCNPMQDEAGIKTALKNREVPARDLCMAFPVSDRSNPEEIFIVYSAIPRISKYNLSGKKLWERRITLTPEVDSLMIDISNAVNETPELSANNLTVRKYISGRSSSAGDLYLTTYTNVITPGTPRRPMWIHQFDSKGNLSNRFKMISDVELGYFPAIDFKGKKIFAPIYRGSDIRTYEF